MPTYEFRCNSCGITVEINRSVDEESALRCDCGQMMSKVFSAPGIVFKGNGWGGKP